MTQALNNDELFAEIPDFRPEPGHCRPVPALVLGVAVFQSAVSLLPSQLVTAGAGSPGQRIRAATRQRVEQRIVGRADRAAQVGLARPPPAAAHSPHRQMPGDSNQVGRIHTA